MIFFALFFRSHLCCLAGIPTGRAGVCGCVEILCGPSLPASVPIGRADRAWAPVALFDPGRSFFPASAPVVALARRQAQFRRSAPCRSKNEKMLEVPKSETSRTHGWPRLRFYNVKTPIRDGPHAFLALQRRAARPNGAARLCTRPKGTRVAQRGRLHRTASSRTRLWAFCPSIPLGRFRVEQ